MRNVFRNERQEFLSYEVDEEQKKGEEDAFVELGKSLGFPAKKAKKAYKAAKKAEAAFHKERVQKHEQFY